VDGSDEQETDKGEGKEKRTEKIFPCQIASVPQMVVGSMDGQKEKKKSGREKRSQRKRRPRNELEVDGGESSPRLDHDLTPLLLHLVLVSRDESDDLSSRGADGFVGDAEGVSLKKRGRESEVSSRLILAGDERKAGGNSTRTDLVDGIDGERERVLRVLLDFFHEIIVLELTRKGRGRKSALLDKLTRVELTTRGRETKRAHIEAPISSELLAEIEVFWTGGSDDSVAHSTSELDRRESCEKRRARRLKEEIEDQSLRSEFAQSKKEGKGDGTHRLRSSLQRSRWVRGSCP